MDMAPYDRDNSMIKSKDAVCKGFSLVANGKKQAFRLPFMVVCSSVDGVSGDVHLDICLHIQPPEWAGD